jgi:Uma2 family endonuclease
MNVRLLPPRPDPEDGAISIPTSVATLDGFRAWVMSSDFPEQGVRASFLGTEVFIDMAPELFDTHNAIKTELYGVLGPLVGRLNVGQFFTDRMLYTNAVAGVSTEPDAMYFTWEAWRAGRVRMSPSPSGKPNYEVVGVLDVVLEVVSDSSERKDLRELRRKYHLAGIPEYWVIDARGDDLVFEILTHTAAEYVSVPPAEDGWLRSAVLDREFRLTRERNPIDLWRYTLHVRPGPGEPGA